MIERGAGAAVVPTEQTPDKQTTKQTQPVQQTQQDQISKARAAMDAAYQAQKQTYNQAKQNYDTFANASSRYINDYNSQLQKLADQLHSQSLASRVAAASVYPSGSTSYSSTAYNMPTGSPGLYSQYEQARAAAATQNAYNRQDGTWQKTAPSSSGGYIISAPSTVTDGTAYNRQRDTWQSTAPSVSGVTGGYSIYNPSATISGSASTMLNRYPYPMTSAQSDAYARSQMTALPNYNPRTDTGQAMNYVNYLRSPLPSNQRYGTDVYALLSEIFNRRGY